MTTNNILNSINDAIQTVTASIVAQVEEKKSEAKQLVSDANRVAANLEALKATVEIAKLWGTDTSNADEAIAKCMDALQSLENDQVYAMGHSLVEQDQKSRRQKEEAARKEHTEEERKLTKALEGWARINEGVKQRRGDMEKLHVLVSKRTSKERISAYVTEEGGLRELALKGERIDHEEYRRATRRAMLATLQEICEENSIEVAYIEKAAAYGVVSAAIKSRAKKSDDVKAEDNPEVVSGKYGATTSDAAIVDETLLGEMVSGEAMYDENGAKRTSKKGKRAQK